MTQAELKAIASQMKKLTRRVATLDRQLERSLRQKPVSEKQLEAALNRAQAANVAFVGNLFKKAGRAVGRVVKSPIGASI
jgi:hypothetical protein